MKMNCTSCMSVPMLLACCSLFLVSGCAQNSEPEAAQSTTVALSLSSKGLTTRAINDENLTVIATLNGNQLPMQRGESDQRVASLSIAPGQPFTLSIRWFEDYEDQTLEIASFTREYAPITQATDLLIGRGSYVTDGFDFDGDGISNFDERTNNTNPLIDQSENTTQEDQTGTDTTETDTTETGTTETGTTETGTTETGTTETGTTETGTTETGTTETGTTETGTTETDTTETDTTETDTTETDTTETDTAQETDSGNNTGGSVNITRINAESAPTIDGVYDSIWNSAQFLGTNDENLYIDSLMVNKGGLTRSDGATEYRWGAMHDGEYLYLYVLGEFVDNATLFADSNTVWADDAIEVFIDGNNSKGSSYDGVDDYQLLMPLLKKKTPFEANNSVDSDGRYIKGDHSANINDGFVFSACYCTVGQHSWELRLKLSSFGIPVGAEFGIDIQLNDDNNGGGRDIKWGWAHPSGTYDENGQFVESDNTWLNPSLMGTAILK